MKNMESKMFLGRTKQIVKTIKEPVDFESFKVGLNQYKPSGIVHPWYSMYKPAWVITNYIDDDELEYYADAWADKTPQRISIEELYKELKRQGLEECFIFTKWGSKVKHEYIPQAIVISPEKVIQKDPVRIREDRNKPKIKPTATPLFPEERKDYTIEFVYIPDWLKKLIGKK